MASELHTYGALLDALRGVRWNARLRPRTATVGAHVARRIGPNTEVTEYRPYRQGDDPRRLDWKLLARTDRAYVRLAPDVATSPTLLVLDASASMGAGLGGESKWRQAVMLCVGLAAVGRAAGDPVGLVIALETGAQRIVPRARGDVVREMIRVVDGLRAMGPAPLAPVLEGLRGIDRVVIISDLLGDADAVVSRVASLVARGTEVVIVQVIARQELTLSGDRAIAVDPENADLRRPLSQRVVREYSTTFERFRADIRRRCLATGARFIEMVDDVPPSDAVRAVVRVASGVRMTG